MQRRQPQHRQPPAESIVEEARDGVYAVPEFQRGFVWKPAQVCEFADSLVQGFPVGSILIWKSNIAVQRGDTDEPRQKSWLIDGQQRTTALCTLFGQRPAWWDDKENGTWSDHLKEFDIKIDVKLPELKFVVRRAASNRYVPVRDILDAKKNRRLVSMARKLTEDGEAFTDNVDIFAEHLENVANIANAVLPIVEIDDAIELTDVAEIFKRLNSTGTRVQQADVYLGVVASRNPGWVNNKLS